MNTDFSIACVIVAFNRKLLLLETLNALLQQRIRPAAIFVIDNHSTDGTPELLLKNQFIVTCPSVENRVTYFSETLLAPHLYFYYTRLTANSGGAGGFHEGIKQAFTRGCTWIWLLDDDACPEPDALLYLSRYINTDPKIVALASSVWGEDNTLQLAHRGHFTGKTTYPYLHTPLAEEAYQQQTESIEMASFVGLLLKREVVQKIGLPKREFFIHHDDVEYCLRLKTVGKMLLVPASRIIHKDQRNLQHELWRSFLGRRSKRIPFNRLWLFYFSVRNAVYLSRQQLSGFHFVMQSVRYFLKLSVGIIIYDKQKTKRLYCLYQAFKDGCLAKFNNDYPFKLKDSQKTTQS